MASKDKDKSLLEIAVELLEAKKKEQPIMTILKEVMEIKGIKSALAKELAPQFLLDFMQSGYFVYCGDDLWDLKDRQSTDVLDKDGGDYESTSEYNDEVEKHERWEDVVEPENLSNSNDDDDDDDDDQDQDELDDDLQKAFNQFDDEYNAGLVLVPEEGEEDEEL